MQHLISLKPRNFVVTSFDLCLAVIYGRNEHEKWCTRNEDLLQHMASHVDRRQSVGHETDETRVEVRVE